MVQDQKQNVVVGDRAGKRRARNNGARVKSKGVQASCAARSSAFLSRSALPRLFPACVSAARSSMTRGETTSEAGAMKGTGCSSTQSNAGAQRIVPANDLDQAPLKRRRRSAAPAADRRMVD